MKTVKELSTLTGISVRTLHYYDEIGLFKPTNKSEAGYRLYDDNALEILQQILFFREFDIPLKEIKNIIENPTIKTNEILQMQQKMLVIKKERIERLVMSIDSLLKGNNEIDFSVFSKREIEEMFQTMLKYMTEEIIDVAIKEFGSIEEWKKYYMEIVSSKEVYESYTKVVEWYGGKSGVNQLNSIEIGESYHKRIEAILKKLIAKKELNVNTFEVKEIVGEYGFVMKQFLQIKNEKDFMLAQVQYYRDEKNKVIIDEKYGEGASNFFALAIEAFYKNK